MSLEDLTGTKYIDSLDENNPAAGDNVSEGDDHIRGIKNTIKNTFPNINGAVNASDEELNFVDGVTSNIQTQLDGKQATLGSGDITATELNVDGDGTAGQYLISDGDGSMSWQTLTVDVSGGINEEELTANKTLTSSDKTTQVYTTTAVRDITMPDATTLDKGKSFHIANKSIFNLTIKDSAGNVLVVLGSKRMLKLYVVDNSTSAGSWTGHIVELSAAIYVKGFLPANVSSSGQINVSMELIDTTGNVDTYVVGSKHNSYSTVGGSLQVFQHDKSDNSITTDYYDTVGKANYDYYGNLYSLPSAIYRGTGGPSKSLSSSKLFVTSGSRYDARARVFHIDVDAGSSSNSNAIYDINYTDSNINYGGAGPMFAEGCLLTDTLGFVMGSVEYSNTNTEKFFVVSYSWASSSDYGVNSPSHVATLISPGGSYTAGYSPFYGYSMSVTPVSTSKVLTCHATHNDNTAATGESDTIYFDVFTVTSGSAPSQGTRASYTPTTSVNTSSTNVCMLDDTYFIFTWTDYATNYLWAHTGSISGTTVTIDSGDPIQLTAVSVGSTSCNIGTSPDDDEAYITFQNTEDLNYRHFIKVTHDGSGGITAGLSDRLYPSASSYVCKVAPKDSEGNICMHNIMNSPQFQVIGEGAL